ncbi:ABC transporter substrate-binding protein [Neobacillus sp. 114]|uniref:ABC transporter substrate-binding protein n=1 Tax=Neobacillus sp. 114 TaxID=3048535 RepID=UPI0024C29EEA|nr:ABC transporter substrate-binding protein [Neobacillus sp. 114]
MGVLQPVKKKLFSLFLISLLLMLAACGSQSSSTKETSGKSKNVIKVGLSVPLSGAAANWGITAEWAAKQAANKINEQGGVTADGKKYTFEVIAYDNKYNATTGGQVAQTLINKDKVKFIVGSVGSAPTLALHALTEKAKVIHFTSAWTPDIKGEKFPYTFTTLNTPREVIEPIANYILDKDNKLKKVAVINPNDATGTDTSAVSVKVWKSKGIDIVVEDYYERGTTEFSQIVTKVLAKKPDIIDLGATPPGDAGLILKALSEQGWNGVKIIGAGTSADQLIDAAGDAANDVYLGLAPDFSSEIATTVQKDLAKKAKKDLNQTLNAISMQPYDGMMSLKAAIDKTKSLDPDKLIKALQEVKVESSYGPTAFGYKETYGIAQQMLLPITITQIQAGTPVEVKRMIPKELEEKGIK